MSWYFHPRSLLSEVGVGYLELIKSKMNKKDITGFANAVLNSYAVLFFSTNRLFAILLLIVSFFNPYGGLAGFVAVLIALAVCYFTNLNREQIEKGMFSYNALITGIGMGSVFHYSPAFWLMLAVIAVISVVLSVVLKNILGRKGLPFLTIPFVLCMWMVFLSVSDSSVIQFTYRNIYWLNNLYAAGEEHLVNMVMFMENMPMPKLMSIFFRALSSLYFQNNILAGMIMAIGILLHSRITFSLIVVGLLSAYGFNYLLAAHPEGMDYYLLGGNFILVAVAIGAFYVVPSVHSYLWALLSVPFTFLIVMGLGKIMGQWGLPAYSLPFSITVLCLLYFFMVKGFRSKVALTPLQLYSPEKNLYHFLNTKERLNNTWRLRLQLPFMGKWMVSQGYDGTLTHKGDWGKALDFIIVDEQLKTYKNTGTAVEDFYCYGKPVLAAADGFVQQTEDYLDDNEIGKIDQEKNWGNTIVLKHAEGLYTKLSHLKKGSIRVKPGDYVKQGDVIAACGNSGRSPEPHLHFQVQATAFIGSKTMEYPFALYVKEKGSTANVMEFSIPQEVDMVYNFMPDASLQQAFEWLPGQCMDVAADGFDTGRWEVFTDAYNHTYIWCHTTKSAAWFLKTPQAFSFSSFEGNRKSLLYYFFLACYKVYLGASPAVTASDCYPLQLASIGALSWVQDLVAPFYIFSKLHYASETLQADGSSMDNRFLIKSRQQMRSFSLTKPINEFETEVEDGAIAGFAFLKDKKKIKAKCTVKS